MAVKLAWRNKRAGQKISRGLDISPATYRSRVDMKVLRKVELGFGRADFPYSRDPGFAAPECRLVPASNSITVIGTQKCLFYPACFRCDSARGIGKYNASVRRCATMAQAGGSVAPKCPLRREVLSANATTLLLDQTVGCFLIPSWFSLISRDLQRPAIATPATQRKGKYLCQME